MQNSPLALTRKEVLNIVAGFGGDHFTNFRAGRITDRAN